MSAHCANSFVVLDGRHEPFCFWLASTSCWV